jgi:hypothetical protein
VADVQLDVTNPSYRCPPYSVSLNTESANSNYQECLFTVCPGDTVIASACGSNAGGYGDTLFPDSLMSPVTLKWLATMIILFAV